MVVTRLSQATRQWIYWRGRCAGPAVPAVPALPAQGALSAATAYGPLRRPGRRGGTPRQVVLRWAGAGTAPAVARHCGVS
jgi:hypothetical protein